MAIILICLLCALICVVGLMAVTRCVCDCYQLPVQRTTDHELGPNNCFKRKVINSLPKHIFKSSSFTADAASADGTATMAVAECVICLSEFSDGEEVKEFPGCCHAFHTECIDTWLIESHSFSCPSCRQALGVVNQCQNQTCRTGASADSQPQGADFLP